MFTYWNVYHFYATSMFARGKKNTKLTLTFGKYLIVLAPRITSSFQFDIFTFSRYLHSYIAVTPIFALCILVIFANYAYRFPHRIFTMFSIVMKLLTRFVSKLTLCWIYLFHTSLFN